MFSEFAMHQWVMYIRSMGSAYMIMSHFCASCFLRKAVQTNAADAFVSITYINAAQPTSQCNAAVNAADDISMQGLCGMSCCIGYHVRFPKGALISKAW